MKYEMWSYQSFSDKWASHPWRATEWADITHQQSTACHSTMHRWWYVISIYMYKGLVALNMSSKELKLTAHERSIYMKLLTKYLPMETQRQKCIAISYFSHCLLRSIQSHFYKNFVAFLARAQFC